MTAFSLLLAFGSMSGLTWVVHETPPRQQLASLNAGVLALFSALVGGRTAYVAVHWGYFQDHLAEIPQIWLGGLAWPGALAGGILGAVVAAWITTIPVGIMVDRLVPLLASLSITIWLGCWMTDCAYGAEVSLGLFAKDEWGNWKKRLPVQLSGAIISAVLFWGIEYFRGRSRDLPPGLTASIALGGISLVLLVGSLLRVDPYPLYRGLRLETWAALVFLGVAILSGGSAIILGRR